MTALLYFCIAPDCEEVGKEGRGGRLFCAEHLALLRHCDCVEGRQWLLPRESCEKCGKVNEGEEI